MDFETFLEKEIRKEISSWQRKDIYAISFFVSYNEENSYRGINRFPEFSVGYNTEEFCEDAGALSEERWNYACWEQNNTEILSSERQEAAALFLEWCKSEKIGNVGVPEKESEMYDENFNYIGKGPGGFFEFVGLISKIARRLQTDGFIKEKFGNIPVIIHDSEYTWYTVEATEKANPEGEAETFLKAVANNFEEG